MERLTEKCWRNLDPWECCGQDHFCGRGCHDLGGCTNGCIVPRLYARLAAYEDTGLESEGVEAQSIALAQCKPYVDAICDEHGKILINPIRLAELAQAEKDGRLVVLPCKLGDILFAGEDSPVLPVAVVDIGLVLDGPAGEDWECVDNIGKTVFLTREEAETALKKREEADSEAD